ncbi:MAG: MFS transporter [Rhizobiales bacterium]|nr:MFS transporter [Hyphomicrobiales bacterium]
MIFTLGALSFAYAFLQRVAPSAMVSDLMGSFSVGAAVLGNLSAIYFYAYVALQMPIGALVDRWGPRKIITSFLLLGGAGSLVFSLATTIEQAYLGRLLVGIGASCGLIAPLALAAKWFPPKRFAFLSGTAMLFGVFGGFIGQGPFASLVGWVGWHSAMLGASAFAICLALAIWIIVRDAPAGPAARTSAPPVKLLAGMRQVVRNREAWALGFVASACSGPMLAFGALWGVPYMADRFDLSRTDAAFYTSMMLVGWAAGAPFGGWFSDAVGRRKPPLIFCTAACTLLVAALFYGPDLPLLPTVALLMMIGFMGAWIASIYAFARETVSPRVHGAVTGFVNMMTVAAGALLQPVVGLLLDMQWDGTMENDVRVYSRGMYETAFLSIAAYSALGIVAILFVKETFCTQRPGTMDGATGGV